MIWLWSEAQSSCYTKIELGLLKTVCQNWTISLKCIQNWFWHFSYSDAEQNNTSFMKRYNFLSRRLLVIISDNTFFASSPSFLWFLRCCMLVFLMFSQRSLIICPFFSYFYVLHTHYSSLTYLHSHWVFLQSANICW